MAEPITAVIGAGIVGLCCALELQRAGHQVLIIESGEPGGRQAASYGNGTWISPGAIMPISTPGLWKRVPGFLLDPKGPFIIRWRHLPGIMPWLIKFVRAGSSWAKIEACAAARFPLCRDAVRDHAAIADEAGVGGLLRHGGLMYVYRDRSEFLSEAREWRMRRDLQIRFSEFGEAELRDLIPALGPSYRFGVRLDDGAHVIDNAAYCQALAALAVERGAIAVKAQATGFDRTGGRLQAVQTDQGPVSCDRAVIAAGIGGSALAQEVGDIVPMISERGYHAVVPNPGTTLPLGIMPYDGKMGVVSTAQGLRLAGQVELASVDAAPNWRRADILLTYLDDLFPGVAKRVAAGEGGTIDRWMGHRPSTPDGLPVIGQASGCADVFHAFGHGHVGLVQAPATARLLAALMDGRPTPFDPAPYAAKRFA